VTTDQRITHYASIRDVTRYLRIGKNVRSVDTPASMTSLTVVFTTVAESGAYRPGDSVRVYSDETPAGEIREVINITSKTLTLDTALTGTYTTNFKCQLISPFTPSGAPGTDDVLQVILDIEEYIERKTHNSWRLKTNSNAYKPEIRWVRDSTYFYRQYARVYLFHQNIKTFNTTDGDKFTVFNGSSDVDYVATKTNQRNGGDYWLNEEAGYIDIYTSALRFLSQAVTIKQYRYGKVTSAGLPDPPRDIKEATAKLVASELLAMNSVINVVPSGGDGGDSISRRIERLKEEAEEILVRYTRQMVF
jgi:hypothetical protein